MQASDFQRAAEADGFKVARTEMIPGRVTPEHDHAWDIRGLVLQGCFTVDIGGAASAYEAGEIFEVPAGLPHSERHDPAGGLLLVGRRPASDRTDAGE